MKRFSVRQQFAFPAPVIVDAFRTESTWQAFQGLPFVGDPRVERFGQGATTVIAMAYKVTMELPALADKFIDPDKLTFIEQSELREDGSGIFTIVPDHYRKLLAASGNSEVAAIDASSCERIVSGSVDVTLGWTGKLLESPVEEAIVTGLSRALTAQATQVQLE